MTNIEYDNRLNDFKKELLKQYLEELEQEDLEINDYRKFSLSEIKDSIVEIFVNKLSSYKIGDEFQKIETFFYPNSEKIVKSVVWTIYDISILYSRQNDNVYHFAYHCENVDKSGFVKRESFNSLKSFENEKVKYYFEKLT